MTEKTPNQAPQKRKPGRPPKTAKQKAVEALQALSPEERAEIGLGGTPIPVDVDSDAPTVFGYRCDNCSGIALEFQGEKFTDSQGRDIPIPPVSTEDVWNLAWVQRNPVNPKFITDRVRPKCQKCSVKLDLWGNKQSRFLADHVVRIEEYEAARAEYKDRLFRMRNGWLPKPYSEGAMVDHEGNPIVTREQGVPDMMGTEERRRQAEVLGQRADAIGAGNLRDVITR